MPFQYTCEHCGKTFTHHGRPTRNDPHKFCSKQCARPLRPLIPQADGTFLVPLSQGAFAVVDGRDAERVSAHHWHLRCGYAAAHIGGKHAPMHRFILDAPPGWEIDHKNRDRLNNRRGNLRVATRSQNQANSGTRAASGFRGVLWDAQRGKWRAYINNTTLGRFEGIEDAARAFDGAARARYGEFAVLNFPEG
jgi:hypothetical protein